MSTLGQTIALIAGDINRGTDFYTRIQEALVNAIKFYRARRYGFNTKRATYLVSAEYTSLSADFIEVDSVVLQIGTRLKDLKERTFTWIDEEKTDASFASEPIYFAIQDRQLRLFPQPDVSYSLVMAGHYDLSGISLSTSDSTTTNAWFDEGYELIKTHATVEILEVFIDGDEAVAKAQRLRNREGEVERELKRRANREQSSGNIKAAI